MLSGFELYPRWVPLKFIAIGERKKEKQNFKGNESPRFIYFIICNFRTELRLQACSSHLKKLARFRFLFRQNLQLFCIAMKVW